jgi:hypothetical protein
MLKSIAFAAAIGASAALIPAGAGAQPLAQARAAIDSNEVLLVREGCGPGMQYSMRLRRCVVDTWRAQRRDFRRDVYRCGPGLVWNDRFRRCVFIR